MDSSDNQQLRTGEIAASLSEMHAVIQKIEEEFGVMMADDELASVRTAGQLHRLIQLELTSQPNPPPALAFLRLRLALQKAARTSHTLIRPSTQLNRLFPRSIRKQEWKHLADLTSFTLPPLRPLRWVRDTIRILTGVTASSAFVAMVLATRPFGLLWFPPLLIAAFVGLVTYRVLFVVTQSLVLEFPMRSLGELAQTLVETCPERFREPGSSSTSPEAAWQQLIQTLAHELSIDPADIHPDSSIFLKSHFESNSKQKPHSLSE